MQWSRDSLLSSRHVWLEYEGVVCDITPTVEQETAMYFGTGFENSTVWELMEKQREAHLIVESVW